MKIKMISATTLLLLTLFCTLSAYGQPQLPAPRTPAPDKRKIEPTGTVTGGIENVINSKLMVYTKDGLGTTNTSVSGEFSSQLRAVATVNREFALLWSRTKAAKTERGLVYIRRAGTDDWLKSGWKIATATIPTQSTEVNIPINLPNYPVGNYELKVIGDTGSSSKVTVNYNGSGGGSSSVAIPSSGSMPAPASTKSPVTITSLKFTPMIGSPGESGYKRARLVLNLRTAETTTISRIDVDVLSGPWTNPELLTSSTSQNSPIVIFSKKWTAAGGSYQIVKNQDNFITVVLRRNSTNDVEDAQSGPGFYSPADWGLAFAQTTNATFRWKVDGKLSGSSEQSAKKPWQWGAP
jgi:hypothetical protein